MPVSLADLENHPKFHELTYEEQQELRMKWLSSQLKDHPMYPQLGTQGKKQLVDQLLARPPVLGDKELEGRMRQTYQAYQQGDERAAAAMKSHIADAAFQSNNVLANLFFRKILPPVAQVMGIDEESTAGEKIRDFGSPDVDDVADFYMHTLSNDAKNARTAKLVSGAASTLGVLSDLIPLYTMGAGVGVEKARGLGKVMVGVADKAFGRAKTQLGLTTLRTAREVGHAVATSALGVARENALEVLNNKIPEDYEGQQVLERNFNYFKGYFLGDVAMNVLTGVALPMAKNLKHIFKGTMKGAQFYPDGTDEALVRAVSGAEVDPAFLDQLPQSSREVFEDAMLVGKLNSKGVHRMSNDELFRVVADQNGFVARKSGEKGWKVRAVTTTDDWHTFKNIEEAQEWMHSINEGIPPVAQSVDAKGAAAASVGLGRVEIRELLEGQVKEVGNIDLLSGMIAPRGGEFTQDGVRSFVKAYARAQGAEDEFVKSLAVRQGKNGFEIKAGKDRLGVLPREVTTGAQEKKAIRDLVDNIDSFTEGGKPKPIFSMAEYEKQIHTQRAYTPAWIESTVETVGGSIDDVQGRKILRLGDEVVEFEDMNSVGDYIIRRTMTEEDLAHHLRLQFGYKLRMGEDGSVEVLQGAKATKKGASSKITAESAEALVEQHPEFLPKASSRLAPTFTFINNSTPKVRYIGRAAMGSYADIAKHLDSFQDTSPKKSISFFGDSRITADNVKRKVEVYVPDIEYRKVFSSVKKAQEWLQSGKDTVEELKKIGMEKGFRIHTIGKTFVAYGEGGKTLTASNVDELKKVLSDVPSPEVGPELTGMNPDLFEGLEKPPTRHFQPPDLVIHKSIEEPGAVNAVRGWAQKMFQHIATPDAVMTQMVEQGGDPQVLKYYRQASNIMRYVNAQDSAAEKAVKTVFRQGTSKKLIPRERRIAIGRWVEADGETKERIAREANLTSEEMEMGRKLRTMYNAMFEKFGVEGDMYIDNYLPRIRTDLQHSPMYADVDSYLKKTFEGKPPGHLDAFFKHTRYEDFYAMNIIEDPLEQFTYYSKIGNRERFLGPVWEEADTYIKGMMKSTARGTTNFDLMRRFNIWRADVMGLPAGVSEELLAEGAVRFWNALGIDRPHAKGLVSMAMKWGYLSSMGFRAWLPVRNAHQIWTTLAPRIGNSYVARAVKEIADDGGGKIYQRLKSTGVITDQLPIHGSEFVGDKALDDLLQKGLTWFRSSDEFTRAVAYRSAEIRFDEAFEQLRKTGMDQKRFMKLSGLSKLPMDLQKQAVELMQEGKYNAVRDLFGNEITREALFVYDAGGKPLAFRGNLGKLFGMFGRFPTYYAENLRKAMRYGDFGEKLAFGGTMVGNATILYGIFNELLGIDAGSFVPYAPLAFTGGPYYQMLNQMTALPGVLSGDYRGRQAAAELLGIKVEDGKLQFDPSASEVTRFGIPYVGKTLARAVEHFNNGDYYHGLLAVASAPMSPSWLSEGYENPLDALQ